MHNCKTTSAPPCSFILPFEKIFVAFLSNLRVTASKKKIIYWFKRERNIDLLFHLFMHSLVVSYMCSDWVSDLQLWHIRTIPYPTELPGQGQSLTFNLVYRTFTLNVFIDMDRFDSVNLLLVFYLSHQFFVLMLPPFYLLSDYIFFMTVFHLLCCLASDTIF